MNGSTLSIDVGLHTIKVGYAGLDASSVWAPDALVPIQTRFRNNGNGNMRSLTDCYVGLEEKLLQTLRIFSAESDTLSIIFGVSLFSPVSLRGALLKLAMESFGCSKVYFAPSPVLSCVAYGATTATVIDCGHSHTSLCHIRDGTIDRGNIWSYSVSGARITDCLVENLRMENDLEKNTVLLEDLAECQYGVEKKIVTDIKKSSMLLSGKKINKPARHMMFELPDKSSIAVGKASFEASELLFSQTNTYMRYRNSSDQSGRRKGNIADMWLNSLETKRNPNRTNNLIFAGGTSMIKGFDSRFRSWVQNKDDSKYYRSKFSIQKSANRRPRTFSAWAGGTILGSFSTMSPLWISKREYEEHGDDSLCRRLFH